MFQYPAAFTSFIQAANSTDHAVILQEIEDAKATVTAQQKVAKDVKCAEIEPQIAKRTSAKTTYAPKKVVSKQERITGKPMTFYVFQNSTFEREYQGGYLWAPITNKSGATFHHWNRMMDVRAGDVILHGYNGYVQAVSIAQAACYDCVQPKELRMEDSWDLEGRRIDSVYILLKHPVKTSDHQSDIIRLCNTKYAPFNKYGTGNQGYLFAINREMAKIFLYAAVTANPYLKGNQTIRDLLSE